MNADLRTAEAPPHCDSRVLHAPGECEFCDQRPEWQALRQAWGIAFTGHVPKADLPRCGQPYNRHGYREVCRQARGHDGDHLPMEESEATPCPADVARPPGSPGDHRRWGGNTATSKRGDPSQPAQTLASVIMYGDQGGRERWPLPERVRLRIAQPWRNLGMRRRGWQREGMFWVLRSRR